MSSAELQFWKYGFALGSIDEALKALEELHLLGPEADRRGRPLWLAYFISYARPFTNNKGIGMISPKVVPVEHKATHEGVIKMRNVVFAHTDSEVEMPDGVSMNQLVFTKDKEGCFYPSLRRPQPAYVDLPKIHDLTNAVFENISKEYTTAMNSLDTSHAADLAEGRYRYKLTKTQDVPGSWEELKSQQFGAANPGSLRSFQ